ncbi:Cyclic nucleotide-binding protein [Pseudocohnilembus persalinus]|uniref:Cyclic nucleotide-binding protein n=1 Tax=Pseudocohnilembus persalinus TaxID=266149 RepID=A0A0V0QTN8_PSEPJ|nr:Cyclic nucleotide-binding protein [Pseudocohnilembus persalinus]|eukprot:KRX05533.1 Cyclic nucleotide-binding protein [Pseudocohnilembus persalinus]
MSRNAEDLKNIEKILLKVEFFQNCYEKFGSHFLDSLINLCNCIRLIASEKIEEQEGSINGYIYIVKNGEFQLYKQNNIFKQDDKQVTNQEKQLNDFYSFIVKSELNEQEMEKDELQIIQNQMVFQYKEGDIFGEEEILKNINNRETNAKCSSKEGGYLYVLKKQLLSEQDKNQQYKNWTYNIQNILKEVYQKKKEKYNEIIQNYANKQNKNAEIVNINEQVIGNSLENQKQNKKNTQICIPESISEQHSIHENMSISNQQKNRQLQNSKEKGLKKKSQDLNQFYIQIQNGTESQNQKSEKSFQKQQSQQYNELQVEKQVREKIMKSKKSEQIEEWNSHKFKQLDCIQIIIKAAKSQ